VNKLLVREIQSRQGVPFVILDGYPRTTDQIDFIKACPDIELTRFIHLTCSDKTVLYRTSLREVCLCGASYMPVLKPSKVVGICDLCGQQLFRRNDDELKHVEQRLKIYHTQTPQIISAFKDIYLPIDMDDNDCFKRACRILAASDKNFEFLKNKEIIRM
ncbi:MAG: nucleoside monophosphate kinase, partial [Alphaproteobacteria bacterium]|nr:nucleoside monophosphate kinase [Alphaproteobacteria bacterium]